MAIPARLFTVAFSLWLAAAAAFPTCCWSMTLSAPAPPASAETPRHHHGPAAADPHAHHRGAQAPGRIHNTSLPNQHVTAAGAAQDCAGEREVALRPANSLETLKAALAAVHALPFSQLALQSPSRPTAAPVLPLPGADAPLSAFLTPLRI